MFSLNALCEKHHLTVNHILLKKKTTTKQNKKKHTKTPTQPKNRHYGRETEDGRM